MLRPICISFCLVLLSACSQQTVMRLYDGPSLGQQYEATLNLPLNFKILSLDNQIIKDKRQKFRNQALNLQLAPGHHELILQYEDLWEIDTDNHQMVSSGPLVFAITLQANEKLIIKHASLMHLEQAKQFAQQPLVQLVSQFQSVTASHLKKDNPFTFNEASEIETVEKPILKQLKFWWAQASEVEKDNFLKWQHGNP